MLPSEVTAELLATRPVGLGCSCPSFHPLLPPESLLPAQEHSWAPHLSCALHPRLNSSDLPLSQAASLPFLPPLMVSTLTPETQVRNTISSSVLVAKPVSHQLLPRNTPEPLEPTPLPPVWVPSFVPHPVCPLCQWSAQLFARTALIVKENCCETICKIEHYKVMRFFFFLNQK